MAPAALIIGAGPGLGAVVARRFVAGGLTVALGFRAGGAGAGQVTAHRVDAGNPAAVAELVDRVATAGDLRSIMFNAMAQVPGLPTELDLAGLLDSPRVDVLGPLAAARAAARCFRGPG